MTNARRPWRRVHLGLLIGVGAVLVLAGVAAAVVVPTTGSHQLPIGSNGKPLGVSPSPVNVPTPIGQGTGTTASTPNGYPPAPIVQCDQSTFFDGSSQLTAIEDRLGSLVACGRFESSIQWVLIFGGQAPNRTGTTAAGTVPSTNQSSVWELVTRSRDVPRKQRHVPSSKRRP